MLMLCIWFVLINEYTDPKCAECTTSKLSVYWTVHDRDSRIKIGQLDVTRFIISPFTAQHVSNVSTSIIGSLRLNKYANAKTSILTEKYNTWNKSTVSRKLLKMDVLTFETCWVVNSEIIKRVTSSWSIFSQNYSL
jgi:hypothetical protein